MSFICCVMEPETSITQNITALVLGTGSLIILRYLISKVSMNGIFLIFSSSFKITSSSSFIFIGAPTFLNHSSSVVINVEIILVAYFLFQCRLKKKLPLSNNLNNDMKSHRDILSLSSKYNKYFLKWTN